MFSLSNHKKEKTIPKYDGNHDRCTVTVVYRIDRVIAHVTTKWQQQELGIFDLRGTSTYHVCDVTCDSSCFLRSPVVSAHVLGIIHYCRNPSVFISATLLSLMVMLRLELPHVNVLSKVSFVVLRVHVYCCYEDVAYVMRGTRCVAGTATMYQHRFSSAFDGQHCRRLAVDTRHKSGAYQVTGTHDCSGTGIDTVDCSNHLLWALDY